MKRFPCVIFMALVAALVVGLVGCSRDESNKVVAKVGSRKITVGDVRQMYLRVPPGFLPQGDKEEGKKKFVDDLVNKELLVLAAYERKLDQEKAVLEGMERTEQELLLRDLYTDEIVNKAKVTEKETKQRYEELAREEEVHARHIAVSDSARAEEILKKARAGEDFAALATQYSEDAATAPTGGDLGFFGKELMAPPEFHDAVFKLGPGQISNVVKTTLGYHIIKVDEKRKREMEPFDKMKPRIESELVLKKRMDLARDYLDNVKKRHKFEMKDESVMVLVQAVAACSTAAGATPAELAKRLSDTQKDLPLATMKDGSYKISDFLRGLETVNVTALPQGTSFDDMKAMVESEAIAKPLLSEARREGIHKKKNVKADLERLVEERMVTVLYEKEIKAKVTLTDQEVFDYYNQHSENYGTPQVLRLRKLVVPTRSSADSLLTLVKRGASFTKLVKENSIDPVTVGRDGVWEVKAGANAVVDSLAEGLNIGGIAGPGVTNEGFIIIQMLERRGPVRTPVDLAWPYVQNDVRREKEEVELQALLTKLREKHKPVIDDKVLAEMKLTASPQEAK